MILRAGSTETLFEGKKQANDGTRVGTERTDNDGRNHGGVSRLLSVLRDDGSSGLRSRQRGGLQASNIGRSCFQLHKSQDLLLFFVN